LLALLVAGPAWGQPVPVAPPPPADPAPGAQPADPTEPAVPDAPDAPDEPDETHDEPPEPPAHLAAPELLPPLPPEHPPLTQGLPPAPLAPPALFPSQLEDEDELPLAGIHGGRVYLRDANDDFRVYPGARLRSDFYWGPSHELPLSAGGDNLHPRVAIRRVRFDLHGELFKRVFFSGGIELGGGRIGAGGSAFTPDGRFAMRGANEGDVSVAEAVIGYRFRDWLNVTVGLENAPFSMENRTRETTITFMERNLAIRGFAAPIASEMGITLWGELFGKRTLAYELGVFGGDGGTVSPDARADFAGRVFARPLAHSGDALFFEQAQIGLSARHGERDQNYVDYDYPNIATGQGFVLWQPGYIDSLDRQTRVIPSGAQNAIGGELRLPFELPSGGVIDVRAEAYYVANNTREAVVGFERTNTERFGRVNGLGWYVEIDWWACCTDTLVNGQPGVYRPRTVNLSEEAPIKKGLEVSALIAGIAANYSGATREGSLPDANTPDANIAAYQFGGAVQYWFNWNFRAAINYFAYFTPDSGDMTKNQALVPDNLPDVDGAVGTGNVHHEIGTRLAVTF
jgi:hypothetical protein